MTAQVIKSSTETIPNEANDLIPVSCWLAAASWSNGAYLFAFSVLGLSIMDGELWSRKAIMANKANFSLGHFTFLAYIYGNSISLLSIIWKGMGFKHKSIKFRLSSRF